MIEKLFKGIIVTSMIMVGVAHILLSFLATKIYGAVDTVTDTLSLFNPKIANATRTILEETLVTNPDPIFGVILIILAVLVFIHPLLSYLVLACFSTYEVMVTETNTFFGSLTVVFYTIASIIFWMLFI